MIKYCFIILAVFFLSGMRTKENPDEKSGFTITVDGDQFSNQTFFIPPLNANYANNYFDFKNDPRAKRTELQGFKNDNSLQLIIDIPIHKTSGSFTFIEDNIPTYMGFQFTYEKNSVSTTYLPCRVTVNITRYGNVGEFIEGNFSGELRAVSGSFNDNRRITASGTFKVKRIKDRT